MPSGELDQRSPLIDQIPAIGNQTMFFGLFGNSEEETDEPANHSRRKFLRGGFIRDAVDRSRERVQEADAKPRAGESTRERTYREQEQAEPFDLERGRELFDAGAVRGLQIRYRWNDSDWWDTLMRGAQGVRIVRVQHNWDDH